MDEIQRLTSLLRRSVAENKVPPSWQKYISTLPSEDQKSDELDDILMDLIGGAFEIEYLDEYGKTYTRNVYVRSLGNYRGRSTIKTYCMERGAPQLFRVDGIKGMKNVSTAEAIVDPTGFFREIADKTPTAETLEANIVGIQILASLAVCDGHFDDQEMTVICNYISDRSKKEGINWEIVRQFVMALWPDVQIFDKAVKRMQFLHADEKNNILAVGEKLVLADGILARQEEKLLSLLTNRLQNR